MNQGQYVFSQLVDHLDRNHFNYLARKYDGNKYVKRFSCWNQLLAMMFGQLSNRESLRDFVDHWRPIIPSVSFLVLEANQLLKLHWHLQTRIVTTGFSRISPSI